MNNQQKTPNTTPCRRLGLRRSVPKSASITNSINKATIHKTPSNLVKEQTRVPTIISSPVTPVIISKAAKNHENQTPTINSIEKSTPVIRKHLGSSLRCSSKYRLSLNGRIREKLTKKRLDFIQSSPKPAINEVNSLEGLNRSESSENTQVNSTISTSSEADCRPNANENQDSLEAVENISKESLIELFSTDFFTPEVVSSSKSCKTSDSKTLVNDAIGDDILSTKSFNSQFPSMTNVEIILALRKEIQWKKDEIDKQKSHQIEVEKIKKSITLWENGCKEALLALKSKIDPPQQIQNILRHLNIKEDLIKF